MLGNEFDADERAEVGGGDGFGEAEERHVTINVRHRMLTAREDGGEQVIPIGLKHRRYFIGNHSEKKIRGGR